MLILGAKPRRIIYNPRRAHVYGLFHDGQCVYVGVTTEPNPRYRFLNHRSAFKKKYPQFCPIEFKVLDSCAQANRFQVELMWIERYRALGQAQLNLFKNALKYLENARQACPSLTINAR